MTTGLSRVLGRLLAAWVAALFVLANAMAAAQGAPQDIVATSLVYLKVDFTPTKGQYSGVPQTDQSTGFLISDDGFILTSYHLLEKVSEYAGDNVKVTAAVGDPEAPAATAAIVNGLQPLDVLLLKIRTTHSLPHLTLGRADVLSVGGQIFTSGFHGTEPFNSEGTVSNKFGPLAIGYLWTLNMTVAPGQSGSPVYIADGTVVGILKGENTGAHVGYMVPIQFSDALIAHLRLRDLEQHIATLEANMKDVSSNFDWHAEEQEGQVTLGYQKLVSGAPQIQNVFLQVVPYVMKKTTETFKDQPVIYDTDDQARGVTVNPDKRGGSITVGDVGAHIDARLASIAEKPVSCSRVDVSIVAVLDDGRRLAAKTIAVDIKKRLNK
jgi:S1-C subfamily serine protease